VHYLESSRYNDKDYAESDHSHSTEENKRRQGLRHDIGFILRGAVAMFLSVLTYTQFFLYLKEADGSIDWTRGIFAGFWSVCVFVALFRIFLLDKSSTPKKKSEKTIVLASLLLVFPAILSGNTWAMAIVPNNLHRENAVYALLVVSHLFMFALEHKYHDKRISALIKAYPAVIAVLTVLGVNRRAKNTEKNLILAATCVFIVSVLAIISLEQLGLTSVLGELLADKNGSS